MKKSQQIQSSSPDKSQVGFFQDNQGKKSAVRMMSFASLIIAIIFGFLTFFMKDFESEGIYITFAFLASAVAPKVIQKFDEKTSENEGDV